MISSFFFCCLISRHHSSWLFGCCYFKSCRCWTWRGSDTHARSFIRAYEIWNDRLRHALPYLCVQLKSTHYKQCIMADRTGKFVFTDIWPDNISSVHCSTEAPRHLYRFRTRLTSTCCWGKLEWASENSPIWCGRKVILRLNKCNSCQEKRDRSSSCELGGQSIAPPLH